LLQINNSLTLFRFYPSKVRKEIERVVNDKLKDKVYDHREGEKLTKEISS
jgi:tctex1 domain-containing protein 2